VYSIIPVVCTFSDVPFKICIDSCRVCSKWFALKKNRNPFSGSNQAYVLFLTHFLSYDNSTTFIFQCSFCYIDHFCYGVAPPFFLVPTPFPFNLITEHHKLQHWFRVQLGHQTVSAAFWIKVCIYQHYKYADIKVKQIVFREPDWMNESMKWMKVQWFIIVRSKTTTSRLSLTHHVNKSAIEQSKIIR